MNAGMRNPQAAPRRAAGIAHVGHRPGGEVRLEREVGAVVHLVVAHERLRELHPDRALHRRRCAVGATCPRPRSVSAAVVAHRALLVRQQLAGVEGPLRRRDRHHLRRLRHRRDQQRELQVLRLPDHPDVDQAGAEPDPVLVPGQPGHSRPPWHEPDVAGPDRPGLARPLRRDLERPQGRHPSSRRARLGAAVGCTMVLAIADGGRVAGDRPARHERADAPNPQRAQVRSSRADR